MNTESMSGHDMPRNARTCTPQLIVGVFIMTLGVLLMLDRLDVLMMAGQLLRFWPLALVALGVSLLARRDDAHGRFWGFAWIAVGAWIQLNTLGVIRVGFWDLFWPLLLILFGVNLIRQTMRTGSGGAASAGMRSGHLVAVLSESKRSAVAGEPFGRAGMTAFMGGCALDLRQATLQPGEEAYVDVLGVMSGHEIVVPGGWIVVPDIVNVMAGVEDKRLPLPPGQGTDAAAAPRLVIRGFLFMSGLVVKT